MEWKDHRLEYHNLKHGPAGNFLSDFEKKNIWVPTLVFENTEHKDVTGMNSDSQVKISRFGNLSRSDLDIVEEFDIFTGRENSILWTESYSKEFKCIFIMKMFPFDIQVTQI